MKKLYNLYAVSIKRKIVYFWAIFTLFFILSIAFLQQFFIKTTVLDIEKSNIFEDLKKMETFLEVEKQNLLGFTKDWAAWTDAWLFMQDKKPSFIENSLTLESFINNKINLLAYFDLKGKLKKGFEYYPEREKLLPVDEKLWGEHIERYLKMTDKKNYKMEGLVGISFKNGMPCLVALFPVLKSDFSGPVAGYLIVSRIITEEKQNDIKTFFAFKDLRIENLKETEKEIENSPLIREDSDRFLVNFRKEDIFGNYNVFFHMEKKKNLWNLVKENNLKLMTFSFILVLSYGGIFFLMFKKLILNKIDNLITQIDEVKREKIDEVKISPHDEIGYLAQEINRYINETKKQITEIEKNRKIYEIIAEESEAIIFLFNKQKELLFANSKALEFFNKEKDKIPPEGLFHLLLEIFQINQEEKVFLSEFKLRDNLFVSGWIIPVGEEKESILFIAHDITLLKKEKEKLLDKAYKDVLTSLYNRTFFEISFRKIMNKVQKGEVYSLIFIDLDDLKVINDRFGHFVGDIVIKETANSIRNGIRQEDISARWGGDEFAVIVKGNTDVAKTVAERIQTNLNKKTTIIEGVTIVPSVSIGITLIDSSKDSETIIKEADKSAYDAKKEGKCKVKIFKSLE